MTIRRVKPVIIVTIGVLLACYFGIGVLNKLQTKSKISSQIQFLTITKALSLDSIPFSHSLHENSKQTLVIFFNTECEHCQDEFQEIENSFNQLKSVNLLLISAEPIKRIRPFIQKFKFYNEQTVQICKMNYEDIFLSFGQISYPYLLLYDEQKLVKEFKGETPISEIIKLISI